VHALADVSLHVDRHETLGLVGESGCGKSTLARIAMRLVPASDGQIVFDGDDITTRPRRALAAQRPRMQMVFQDPFASLNPRLTIARALEEPLIVQGRGDAAERRERVLAMLARVGLRADAADRHPHEFSGGQRQRIGLARALTLNPKVIVADEPVSALDVSIQAQVLNLLRRLQSELGLTVIFIAHDLSVVRHMCDRVAVMYIGKIVELAPGEALYGFPRHPYTGALLSAVPMPDPVGSRRKRELLTGDVPSPANPPSACRFHTRCPKAQEICSQDEPPLEDKGAGTVAACHYPLTREEADSRLPAALTAVEANR
jgi:peptide/nickel transport system ATP-binding protein/oligopeptide transport system ATP-binding protein